MWRCLRLRPMPIAPVPREPARVARAAFPKGHRDLRRADEVETWFTEDAFRALFPTHGHPAWPPWRLARAAWRSVRGRMALPHHPMRLRQQYQKWPRAALCPDQYEMSMPHCAEAV